MATNRYHALLFWILTSTIFLVVARNVVVAGLNPDDMRALSRDMVYPMYNYGRWISHLISNYSGPFLVTYTIPQLFLTFLLCAWISIALARYSAERSVYFSAFVIFVIGVTHPYFFDILNYNEFILTYVLCLAGSVWAFSNVLSSRTRVFSWIASIQIVAFAFAIYPSFVMLGAYLPILMLLRADKYTLRESMVGLASGVILSLLGLTLYGVEYWIIGHLTEIEPTFAYDPFIDLASFKEKFEALPQMTQRVHSSALSDVGSRSIRLSLLVFSFLSFIFILSAALFFARHKTGSERPIIILRALVALVGALVILPLSFWLMYRMDYLVGRSLGFFGFIIGSMLMAAFSLSERQIEKRKMIVLVLCGSFAITSGIAGWRMANILGQIAARDQQLASQMFDELAKLSDFDGDYVNIVGGVTYEDLRWGLYLPKSTFLPHTDFNAALAPFIKLKRWPIHIPIGPQPCPSFPNAGSTYTYRGVAYICLEQRDVGWRSGFCGPLQHLGGLVCFDSGYVAFLRQKCKRAMGDIGMVRLSTRGDSSEPAQSTIALADYINTTGAGDGCAFFAKTGISGLHDVVVTGFSMDGSQAWREIVPVDRFRVGFLDE